MKGKKLWISAPLLILPLLTGCAEGTAETFEKAGMNTLMGMGVVFSMLILISLLISAFKLINRIESRRKEKAEVKEAPPVQEVKTEEIPAENKTDDTELVAVIAAAIAAYEGTSPDGVVIRSIRNVRAATNWKRG